MTEELVSPQENLVEEMQLDQVATSLEQVEPDVNLQQEPKEEHVPLNKFIKERKKRQELEQALEYERKQRQSVQAEDTSMYESATKHDLGTTSQEIIRVVEERQWIKQNPEKYDQLNLYLEDFLKQRPHLSEAIKFAPNRWEEAYTLMNALTPKQQAQIKKELPKREAPNSPGSVPKSAGINEAVDVMFMSDADYQSWRQSKKAKR